MRALTLRRTFILCAVTLSLVLPATAQSGRAQTPTPTSTPAVSATPDRSVPPAIPAGTSLQDNTRICWTDSSDNEDGFEIGVDTCTASYRYRVGANVTCFDVPPEAQKANMSETCSAYQFWVAAFNAAGSSFPQVHSIPVRKVPPPVSTPGVAVALPETGVRPTEHGADGGLPLVAAGGFLVLCSALTVMMSRRLQTSGKR